MPHLLGKTYGQQRPVVPFLSLTAVTASFRPSLPKRGRQSGKNDLRWSAPRGCTASRAIEASTPPRPTPSRGRQPAGRTVDAAVQPPGHPPAHAPSNQRIYGTNGATSPSLAARRCLSKCHDEHSLKRHSTLIRLKPNKLQRARELTTFKHSFFHRPIFRCSLLYIYIYIYISFPFLLFLP